MARSPQEVFQHHAEVLIAGDLEGIVEDYSDDAVFISPNGVLHGKDGIREAFTKLLGDVPSADWDVPTQIFEGDTLFITWSAKAEKARSGSRRCGTRCSTTDVDLRAPRSTPG
jgi:ketosteroid isomerase-like protein